MTMQASQRQLDLFHHVAAAYTQPSDGRLTNEEMYRIAAGRAGISKADLNATSPVGHAAVQRSTIKRAMRWRQRDLADLGLIQRVADQRGVWELTEGGRQKLRKIQDGVSVLGFSTKLGVAIWSNCKPVFERLDEPIFLCLSSPPFPLNRPRAYGNPSIADYGNFIVEYPGANRAQPCEGRQRLLAAGRCLHQGQPRKIDLHPRTDRGPEKAPRFVLHEYHHLALEQATGSDRLERQKTHPVPRRRRILHLV
ncbi:hypothetical protein GTP90_00600 [Rugamonas sp. FT81W]|uniref:Restriction system protein Mrr-like N-terminal domain-containing protein n=1 Tax=Duganella vulcania TaxID=2692166 RepID=A0A845GG44_9BURK|nr:hypothetical protein [Duganella vulcania]